MDARERSERPRGGGPGFGGHRGRGRRKRGDVRIALLLLLSDEPRNGYQLMQAIEERTGGRWRPSPGAVYPALSQLEDEGLIRALEHEGGRVFELTEPGQAHLSERHETAAPWGGEHDRSRLGDLKREMHQLHIAAMQVARAGSEEEIGRAAQTLGDARRTLYRMLAEEPGD